jgi:hypothetical protein
MVYTYPQFRKNTTGRSYYQITSENHLLEWQRLGNTWLKHELHASILPEKLLISDLLTCRDGHYQIISESEYQIALGNA